MGLWRWDCECGGDGIWLLDLFVRSLELLDSGLPAVGQVDVAGALEIGVM